MIELKDLVILAKHAPKEGVNISYDNGLHYIDDKNKYLFKFLTIKNQSAESGSILLNGELVFPNEKQTKSLFFFKINSNEINISVAFAFNKSEDEVTINNLRDELISLKTKEHPTPSLKMEAIVETCLKYNAAYFLIDLVSESNSKNKDSINELLKNYKDKACFIIRDFGNNEVEEEFDISDLPTYSLVVGESTKTALETPNKNDNNAINDKKAIPTFFKENISYIVLIGLETLFVSFLSLIMPYYFFINSPTWGIILLVVLIACFFVYLIFLVSAFNNLSKKQDRALKILLSIIVVATSGISLVLFFVFKNSNVLVEKEKYNYSLLIPYIIASLICLAMPFLVKYISKFYRKLKKK